MDSDGTHLDDTAADLVKNLELTSPKEDQFAHRVLVSKLAKLALAVPDPANIALFGPWGSGKSSIIRLLQKRLSNRRHKKLGVRVVKFDAFKYASSSFHRHLLRQVADQSLRPKAARKFTRSLYQKVERTDLDLSGFRRTPLLLILSAFLGVPLLFGGAAALSHFLLEPRQAQVESPGIMLVILGYVAQAFSWSALPAALLVAVLGLLGTTLPLRRTQNQPTSEEEFEQKFEELLQRIACKRLVVLVDELDRCSPRQVVDVLDALRTFLFVPGTVFFVAADQFVLEKALSIELSREFPLEREIAPYSVGHSHLDKTFQYQVSIPPLPEERVTRFAADLVMGMDGIWKSEGFDIERLMSVLIPSHVRNPRRVKTLINNFVMLYRLARQHYAEGRLKRSPRKIYLEIAKLAALRTEFPLFARGLVLSTRLPRHLLAVASGEPTDSIPEHLLKIAIEYVMGQRQVSVALGRDIAATHEDDLPDTQELAVEGSPQDAAIPRLTSSERPYEAQRGLAIDAPSRQLLRYLQKTRTVSDPRADLVFFDNRGEYFGLDESLAELGLELAVDASLLELRPLFEQLDSQSRIGLLTYLAFRVQSAEPGVEGENLLTSLFALAEIAELPDVEAVEGLYFVAEANAVSGTIRDEWLPGALRVAIAFAKQSELVTRLIHDTRVRTSDELALILIGAADRLSDHRGYVADKWSELLLRPQWVHRAVEATSQLSDRTEFLRAATPYIRTQVSSWVEDQVQTYPFEAALSTAHEQRDKELVATLLAPLFEIGDPDWLGSLTPYLSQDSRGPEAHLAHRAAFNSIPRATTGDALQVLLALPEGIDLGSQGRQAAIETGMHVWTHRDSYAELADGLGLRLAFQHLRRVVGGYLEEDPHELVEAILADIPPMPVVSKSLAPLLGYLERVDDLLEGGAISAAAIADELSAVLSAATGASVESVDMKESQIFARWCNWVVQRSSVDSVNQLAEAVVECAWLQNRLTLAVRMMHSAAEAGRTGLKFPLGRKAVLEQIRAKPLAQVDLAATWLTYFSDDWNDVLFVAQAYSLHYDRIRASVRACLGRLHANDQLSLLEAALATIADKPHLAGLGMRDLVEDIAQAELPERKVARLLVESFGEHATSNDRRAPYFAAWNMAEIVSKEQRRSLVKNVVVPTLEKGGAAGLRLVYKYRHLLEGVDGIKRDLQNALKRLRSPKHQRMLDEIMSSLPKSTRAN